VRDRKADFGLIGLGKEWSIGMMLMYVPLFVNVVMIDE